MARFARAAAVRQIQTLYRAGSLGGLTDGELLKEFVAGSEAEAAFEVLVERHGPMVRATCRSLLGDFHEGDDAFQATFLVLARRAGLIRNKEAVASWLYGVASRICARARAEAMRRRTLSRYLTERARHDEKFAVQPPREETPELFDEIARLPERYRAPIVLCYLECQTHEQAARALCCPVTTLQTRLLRAKAKLRTRLARRGLAPTVGLLAIGTAGSEASAIVAGPLPLALAGSTARAAARFVTAGSAEIGTTILTMTQYALGSLRWNRLKHAAGLSAGLAAGILLTVITLFAAAKKPDEAVKVITGRVVDTAGGPIAGARVWLHAVFDETDQSTAQATTDEQGHYALAVPEIWGKRPEHERRHVVWAHAAGHQISTANAYQALSGKAVPVNVTLGPATDTSFLVVGPDGRPVAGAVVEPFHFKTASASYEFPPPSVLPAVRGITDATGRAQLPALPREGFMTVQVTSAALGIQRLRMTDAATEPAQRTISLRPVGSTEGRIVASQPEWAAGVSLYVTTELDRVAGQAAATEGGARAVTQADGSFTVPAIATGKLRIGARVDQTLPVRPRLPGTLEVRAGQATHAEIPLEKAVRATGVIRVKDTEKPVAGAWISVGYGSPRQNDTVVSDANGEYSTYVLNGDVTTHVIMMPEPFVQLGEPWNERHHLPTGATTFDLPAIEVVRGVEIKGRLVDLADRPLANLRVVGATGNRRYAFATTDSNGEFRTNSVPSGMQLGYSVWVNDHESPVDATIVNEDPLLLRALIAPSPSTTLAPGASGSVVDGDGRPVEGAQVTVFIEVDGPIGPGGGRSMRQRRQLLTTDAGGQFRLPEPIAKGTRYRAIVNPGTFAIAASHALTPENVSGVTFPPITAQRLRSIAGRVLDTDGHPIVGATVLNWGNAAPLTSANSGSSGRFHLDSLTRRSGFIFVEAPGYRFHCTTPSPAKSMIDIVIRRDDQPPERATAALGPPIAQGEAIELAAKVIKPYSDRMLDPASDAQARARVLEVLAQIDPDGAWQKCQVREAPWESDAVRLPIVRHRATTSVDEADAIARTIKSDFWRLRARIDLVDVLPHDHRDAKIRVLEEVARDATEISEASLRIHFLVDVAKRLIVLDRRTEARRLVDGALAASKTVDAADPRLSTTRLAIGNLARLDLKAALALIPDRGDARTINDFRGLIAQEVADNDPAEAERLIGQMNWNSSETYAVKACRRMAPVDLARAGGIEEALKNDVLRGYALGTMAGALPATDRAAAKQLLADSFSAFKQAVERGQHGLWGGESAATMAAVLLPIVERIDPDHLAEAVQRVLALRWYPRSMTDLTMTTPDTSAAESLRVNSALAALVTRYDHALGREIAAAVLDALRVPLSEIENRFLDRYAVLPTLALADPHGTAALVEIIPALKEEGIGQSRDAARLIVAQTLTAPDTEFWTIIRRSLTDLELVERED